MNGCLNQVSWYNYKLRIERKGGEKEKSKVKRITSATINLSGHKTEIASTMIEVKVYADEWMKKGGR